MSALCRVACGALLAIAMAELCGCAAVQPVAPVHWAKIGSTQEAFMQDRYNCAQQAQQPRSAGYVDQYGGASSGRMVTSRGLFVSCMEARGYTPGPEGPFVPPPEALIQMVE